MVRERAHNLVRLDSLPSCGGMVPEMLLLLRSLHRQCAEERLSGRRDPRWRGEWEG